MSPFAKSGTVSRMRAATHQWCTSLLRHSVDTQSDDCIAPLTKIDQNTAKMVGNARKNTRESILQKLGGGGTTTPSWMAHGGQDWWVWFNHARFLGRPGVYVDLATNDPIWRSNTFFLDACLQWHGVCIEPSAMHHKHISNERRCELEPRCISDVPHEIQFHDNQGYMGGGSRIIEPNEAATGSVADAILKTMQCTTLAAVLRKHNLRHVDFLSLHVEQHEVRPQHLTNLASVTASRAFARIGPDVSPPGTCGPR